MEPMESNDMHSTTHASVPSAKAQSWGTFISIVIIVLMVVVGAYYAWNKRMAEQRSFNATVNAGQS